MSVDSDHDLGEWDRVRVAGNDHWARSDKE